MILRDRAGKWTFNNAENKEMDVDYGSQLTAETPATIDINFILDERSREFYGEGYRWFDLVRTQSGTNMPIATKSAEMIKETAIS